jgi:hypothetical protein
LNLTTSDNEADLYSTHYVTTLGHYLVPHGQG